MADRDSLGDRMKDHERITRTTLPRRTYTIIRVDGRAFHTYLRGAQKPYDFKFMDDMGEVAKSLCEEVSGTVFAYHQSDEISLLVTDFATSGTQPWFGGEVQKIVSTVAAVATAALIRSRGWDRMPTFDARVFTISDPTEVGNYFIWRQRDAVRNSISMAAQAQFSHKQLHGVNTGQMQERLWAEKGINWNDYPVGAKRGAGAGEGVRRAGGDVHPQAHRRDADGDGAAFVVGGSGRPRLQPEPGRIPRPGHSCHAGLARHRTLDAALDPEGDPMCPCMDHHVCQYHEDAIRDLFAALAVAERSGDDDQRRLRGELHRYGIKADIVKLKLDTEAWERQEAAR